MTNECLFSDLSSDFRLFVSALSLTQARNPSILTQLLLVLKFQINLAHETDMLVYIILQMVCSDIQCQFTVL